MKILAFVITLFMVSEANADFILGVSAGPVNVKFDTADASEQPVNFGVSLAYDLRSLLKGLGLEAELTRSVSSGEVANIDLEMQSQGIYLTYSTSGDLFVRGRFGVMDASLSAGDLSEDEGGETYGLAIGKRFNNFNIELDYTSIDDDVNYLSLKFKYRFKLGL